jgi:hypothetical protein
MKKYYKLFLFLFFIHIHICAAEVCPQTLTADGVNYTPPAGWIITKQKLYEKSKEVLFYYASYNYDHTNKENNNKISCRYEDRTAQSIIEITTIKDNLPKPENGPWRELDSQSLYCFPHKPLASTECTF